MVPYPREGWQLAQSFASAAREMLRRGPLLVTFVGATAVTGALLVPWVGPWLGLGLVTLAAGLYGDLIAAAGRDQREESKLGGEQATPGAVEEASGVESGPERPLLGRLGGLSLGLLAAVALVAPMLLRQIGHILPPIQGWAGSRTLMLVALVGWVVVPLVLMLAYSQDASGRLTTRRSLAAMARHPWGMLATVLIVPLGLIALETLIVFVAWLQGHLPLLVNDLFPTPALEGRVDGLFWNYQYDHTTFSRPFSLDPDEAVPVYMHALRRGFTLVSAIPGSLPVGLKSRIDPLLFLTMPTPYLLARAVLSVMILAGLGWLLGLQARWLGLVAAVGAPARLSDAKHVVAEAHDWDPQRGEPAADLPPGHSWNPVLPASALAAAASPVPLAVPAWGPDPGTKAPGPLRAGPAVAPATTEDARLAPPPRPAPTYQNADPVPIYAPAAVRPAAPGGSHGPLTTPPTPTQTHDGDEHRPCVLVVEDEIPLAEALARTLSGRGFHVVLAGDVAAALRKVYSVRPDLIVLDLMLPDGNGLEVCRALRGEESTCLIPILITSCLKEDSDQLDGLNAGADDYVAKPYNLDVLIARIGKLLDRRPLAVS